MKLTKPAATLIAVTALLAGSTVAASAAAPKADFRTEALASGLTDAQATSLQHRVDDVLALHPGGRQVSATKVQFEGVTANVAPTESAAKKASSKAALTCASGHLCMTVNGTNFDFYKCQTWVAHNWKGNGPYINNQTRGTVAKFYNQNGSVRWTSTAPDSGTATWDPIYSIRPC